MAAFVLWMATFGARASALFGETSAVQASPVASAAQLHAELEG